MKRRTGFVKRAAAGMIAVLLAVGSGIVWEPEAVQARNADDVAALTVDLTAETGAIIHGAAGFLYGISSEGVPTTNTIVPLKPKVLCTKGVLGTEHPYGDARDVAKTFLESGGEQVMMYNSNYYGVFGVTANYQDYAKVLKETIAPEVVRWKAAWNEDHKDDNLSSIDIDKALIYIPINEGTPKIGADYNTCWKAYYDAIKEADPNAVIAGPNSCAYNLQFENEFDPNMNMEKYINYCAQNDCMPDIITWHDLEEDKIARLSWEMDDFKRIWNGVDWTKYKAEHPDLFMGGKNVPEIPQICINEYAQYEDCGVPGRLVNWIGRLEDEKIYGCLPFWHQANNLNDLTADANQGNGAWWLYKWYGDMSGQTVAVSSNTAYNKLYGVASIDDGKKIATTLLGGVDGTANVNLLHVNETAAFQNAQKVHVNVQSTAFSGYHGAKDDTLTILDGVFPVNSDGSVTLSLRDMKFSTAYNVTMTEAGEGDALADAAVSQYQKVYEAEEAELDDSCDVKKVSDYNPKYYMSAGKMVEMPQGAELSYKIWVPTDGKYQLDFIYGNDTGSSRNDMKKHNPQNVSQEFSIDGQNATELVMESTLLMSMTGIKTMYADLGAGEHTVHITTFGTGKVGHDSLTVTWCGAKGQPVKSFNKRYEAELADFNILLGNADTKVRTETKISGYSGNGYVTGLSERTVPQGGGIRWNVVVGESGLYNVALSYQADQALNFQIYQENTATTLDSMVKRLPAAKADGWNTVTATIYLQKGINVVDVDADREVSLDYMQVQAARESDNASHATVIEAEECVASGSSIQVKQSQGASAGSYVVGMEGDAAAEDNANQYLSFTYRAEKAGSYQMRIYQSNNDICGTHWYNTKIIDKYVSVKVNDGEARQYFFINTFSDDTFKEKTITVDLKEGDNTIKLFNDDSWSVTWGGTTSTPGENVLDNYAPNFDKFVIMPLSLEEAIELPTAYEIDLRTTSGGYATADKNSVTAGGSFQLAIAPEKGIDKVLVNGADRTKSAIRQEDGTYRLAVTDVREDVKVMVCFSEGNTEHRDALIKNAGFGSGTTAFWQAENVLIEKTVADSLEGYFALLGKDSSLSQTIPAAKGNYTLTLYSKRAKDAQGSAFAMVKGANVKEEKRQELKLDQDGYAKNSISFEVTADGDIQISIDARTLTAGKVYVDTFGLEAAVPRQKDEISEEYEYIVDCGDHNTDTLSEGVKFGKRNHVTDQIYGRDVRTGYAWGVVTSEQDQAIDAPQGSGGAYTTYQWANENDTRDRLPSNTTFRYAHDQKEAGISKRYIKYRFQTEPGNYYVTVGMGNIWGNSANPDVYAGSGDENADTKLNQEAMAIPEKGNQEVTAKVAVKDGQSDLVVYALSADATINMNYILIQKEEDRTPSSLQISAMPEKTLYQKGEELDTSGLRLAVVFENGERKAVSLKNCVIEGFDPEREGQQTVTIRYAVLEKTVETSYSVIVREFFEKKLLYFTDCGDHDPVTISEGDSFGIYNSVTDQIYGVDEKAGKSWGVVASDEDPDITETRPVEGSKAVYTKYQRANNWDTSDGLDKTKTFRYADGQDAAGIYPQYVRYRYELDPGTYLVSVCMGNSWGNSANPDVYAGAAGVKEKDTKLNDKALRIAKGANSVAAKEVVLAEGNSSMDVYALSEEATINMNYIIIEKVERKDVPGLTSIELVPPVKSEYQVGEALELTGMKVQAVYEDGARRDLKPEECEVTGFASGTAGSQTVTVTYTENKGTGWERSAKSTFVVTVKGQTPQKPPVDKEALAAAVAEAEKLQSSGYTAESFQMFQKALNDAKKILVKSDATEDEVKAALDLLSQAKRQLKQNTPSAETVKVKKITISGKGFQIAAGKKVKLSATVTPKNAANKELSFTVADKYKKYAAVNRKGVVTTKKQGAGKTVIVTAAAKDGSGCKATVKIKIMKHAVKKIRLKANKTVKAGKKLKVKATVVTNGKNANKKLAWTTSNKKYATVDSRGTVTAKKAGRGKTVTVTAKATDGTNQKASLKIKIKK